MILLNNDELKTIQDLCYEKIDRLKKAIDEKPYDQEIVDGVKEAIEMLEKIKVYVSSKIKSEY